MTQSELQRRLERRGGIKTQGAVSRWINGARIEPPNARALADELGYDREYVLYLAGYGGEAVPELDPYTMSQADMDVVVAGAVRAAEAHLQGASPSVATEAGDTIAIPIMGRIGAGGTIDDDYVVVRRPQWLKRLPGNLQAAEIVGNCLAPRPETGDLAIIDPEGTWGPGTIIAVRSNGGVQVKKFVRHAAGELVLTSNDGEFTLRDNDVRIVGVMLWFQGRAPGM
jgi:SOS-response transcriptional repressor LexA